MADNSVHGNSSRSNPYQAYVSEPDTEMENSPPSSPSQASNQGAPRSGGLYTQDNNQWAFPQRAPPVQPRGPRFDRGAPVANPSSFQAQEPRFPLDGGPVRPHHTVSPSPMEGPPARANGYAPPGASPPPPYTSSRPPSFSSVVPDPRPRATPYSRGRPEAFQAQHGLGGYAPQGHSRVPPSGPRNQDLPRMEPSSARMPGVPGQAGNAPQGQQQQAMPGMESLQNLPAYLAQALRPLENLGALGGQGPTAAARGPTPGGGRGQAPTAPASAAAGNNVNSSGCETSNGCVNSRNCVDCQGCVNSSDLVDCVGCVNCSNCRDCTNCVNCSNCSGLVGQVGASNQHA